MYWETLPSLFWAIFYLFLLATLGTAIINVTRGKVRGLSIVTIVTTISIPFVGIINSIGRAKGVNEYEHLIAHLRQGSIWSIYIVMGLLYFLLYWVILLFKKKTKIEVSY
ncbi:hypothetical protein NC661_04030 [Aquibacillus koreensis]|uniref:Uncharacterized protein n=1 Tax=Aquibacillus koreensis TaxID=279446 RepID=A0A9X4AIL7_9BACI|nr:hypothetical protein [Aquibacillus koreensis]MCT2534859.1 hypothetical protein [Aquibacillus koreensis]MDC3419530.1 hypothetical protein [Aquibacillus koreensis]